MCTRACISGPGVLVSCCYGRTFADAKMRYQDKRLGENTVCERRRRKTSFLGVCVKRKRSCARAPRSGCRGGLGCRRLGPTLLRFQLACVLLEQINLALNDDTFQPLVRNHLGRSRTLGDVVPKHRRQKARERLRFFGSEQILVLEYFGKSPISQLGYPSKLSLFVEMFVAVFASQSDLARHLAHEFDDLRE